jgi:DNA invertase Pin-like site-specific DNA recombinase
MQATAQVPPTQPKLRCAVYTRKSTDEGLDMEYNSLEAQRDAGLSYIASQRHEGWIALPDGYDDGGYSGGNIERPGLKRLMADIEAGRIDIVVVYKIDRLTRSLTDFSKLVDVFDRAGVSFVSVTQQFNTATSMGRLMLNVMLSFAQFEREVTGERIRDKIAASKAKGMWMGGVPPLGYDVVDRHLVVNETEAELARNIFRRYAEHGSAAMLVRELAIEGRTTKQWRTQSGNEREGRTIDQQYLFKMLRNPIYLGKITHKGKEYDGQHPAIISQAAWDAVQVHVARRHRGKRDRITEYPALLAGLLFAPDGQKLLHTYTKKKSGTLYRYYVPYLHKRHNADATLDPNAMRVGHLPAAEIEAVVVQQIQSALRAPEMLIAVWRSCRSQPEGATLDEAHIVVSMQHIDRLWAELSPHEQQRVARLMIERIQLHSEGLTITWRDDDWQALGPEVSKHPLTRELRMQDELQEEMA